MIHYYVIDYNNNIIIVWSDRLTHLLLTDYPTNKAEKYVQYGLLSNNVLEERTKGDNYYIHAEGTQESVRERKGDSCAAVVRTQQRTSRARQMSPTPPSQQQLKDDTQSVGAAMPGAHFEVPFYPLQDPGSHLSC